MSEPAIRLRHVGKRYSHFTLHDVTLDVPCGRVLGLIGPNGAGKSTLLRILMGLVRADTGEVTVLGRSMPAEERWIKSRVGFVSEDMALYGTATLRWHMDLARSVYEGWEEGRAADLLPRLGLNPDQKLGGLSRGQQVKAMLLLALARRADLLILDEPTAGLDPLVRHDLMRLLSAARDECRAIVFSSHHGEDVAGLADDVAFIHGGGVIAHAPVSSFLGGGRSLEAAFLEQVGALPNGRAA